MSFSLSCEVRACSWLCSSVLPAVGYALLSCLQLAMLFCLACSWLCSFTRCGSALLASFHQDHPSVRVYPVCSLELCSRECVSLAPRAPYTPSFAVWCLGLSRACVLLLRSSWHSMSRLRSSWHSMCRSPWHSMALQRRFPTSCSPVHVLTHVFSFARFFTCCAWLRVVWLYRTPLAPLSSARCACRGRCLQAGRELRHAVFVATLVRRREHLVAGACASKVCTLRLSSGFALLGFLRSSTVVLLPLPALCRRSSHVAALHESALSICVRGDRGSLPWFGFPRFGLRAAVPPKLSLCDSSQLSPLRLAVCLVVSGHSSTQTCSN